MTPTFKLTCHECGRFLGMVPFPVLCTGSVRWAPQTDDGLIYLRCQCRSVSRYEIAPNLTQGELLAHHFQNRSDSLLPQGSEQVTSPLHTHQEAA